MKPVVTPEEMRAIDAEASEEVETLIARAGAASADVAADMLGEVSDSHVVVIAGRGNNGADGRACGEQLRAKGAKVQVIDARGVPSVIKDADFVIDAAYGTGFRGEYHAPQTTAPVLALDIPSGVDGNTGIACDGAVKATKTVTFAALKPGLLLQDGKRLCGEIIVKDIGLDVSRARAYVVEDSDVSAHLDELDANTHKWKTAVGVVAGSPGMMGAAMLVTRGSQRAGAGMVRLCSPGLSADQLPISEAVSIGADSANWAEAVIEQTDRLKALVIGPGIGRTQDAVDNVLKILASVQCPVVLDADGLWAVAQGNGIEIVSARQAPTVLTPHDKEFETIGGVIEDGDRIAAVRRLAKGLHATVLLKGSTTAVGESSGSVLLSVNGDARLATAGTGDVLSGVIASMLAQGMKPLEAAGIGAHVHASAALRGRSRGFIAGDLPELIADYLSELDRG